VSAEISISELLQLDNRSVANALPDAIGDRYLYSTNPVFANIRDVAAHLGYRFSHRSTKLWRDYQVLPLLTLHRIIKDKVIPYSDNRPTLARLLKDKPGISLPASFIENNITRNYTLHEAAHCIASTIFQLDESLLETARNSDKEKFVLREILSEAFANSVETTAAAVDPSPLPAFIFSLNSYMKGSIEGKKLLDSARRTFGEDLAYLILFLCYFEANLSSGGPGEVTTVAVLGAADIPLSLDLDTELFARLMNVGFKLNRGFRENTASAYFSLLGYEQEFRSLSQNHWLAHEDNQKIARRVGTIFANVVLRGLKSHAIANISNSLTRASFGD
jgi:hypothetical protein